MACNELSVCQAFSKRKSITQYGNRFAAVHLISRSSQAGPVTRTKLVLRHTPGAHDLSALFPLPATVSSTGSSGRSAEVVVEQPVLNASPAWLAAFSAVVMPPASVPSSSISPTVATNPYEPHTRDTFLSDWHELCSWQCRQWAQLRVTPAHIDPNGSSTLLSRSGSRPGGVTSACSSRCGRFTIFGAVGGAVQLWQRLGDVQQWLLIQLCPPSPAAAVQALAVDPTLKSVLIRYSDGTVVLWKPEVLANESGSKSRDVLFTAMRKQRAIPVVTLPFDSCLRLCSPNPLSSSTEVVFVGIFGQADLLCRVHHAGIGTTDGTLTLHHLRPLSRTAGVPVEPDEYRKRMVALTGSSWLAACSPIDYGMSAEMMFRFLRNVGNLVNVVCLHAVLPMEIRGIYAVRALGMKLGMGRRKKERLQKNLRRVMQAMPWLRTRLTEGSAATELPAIVSGSPDPSIEVAGTAIRATDPEGPTMTTDMVDVVELEVTEPAPTASKLSIAQRLAMETEAVIKLGEDLKQHYLSRVNQFGMGVPKLASVDESTFGAFTEAASSSSPPLVLHGHTAAVVHCGPCLGALNSKQYCTFHLCIAFRGLLQDREGPACSLWTPPVLFSSGITSLQRLRRSNFRTPFTVWIWI